ncbi:dihydropteroate synthase [Clostridiaceae bacterium HSG29]|nr:dihydropteroate synthase [Clostridiaceae bacterium HSG29]
MEIGKKTLIMGILNVTPDSFSDGGKFNNIDNALSHAKKMQDEGADIIDIGGESTRPGSDKVDEDEEISRVIPILKKLKKEIDVIISVDTSKANVAKVALENGANIINDVWGLQKEPEIANYIAEYDVPVVIMHNKINNIYENDIIESMKEFFSVSLEIAKKAGIKKENIFLDPGIGFGKDPEQNIEVMARLDELNEIGYKMLLGTSRKSMIGYILDLPSDQRLEGTIATNVIGVINGYDIVRVHDVKEHVNALKVTDRIYRR